jgi:hypothetical protein
MLAGDLASLEPSVVEDLRRKFEDHKSRGTSAIARRRPSRPAPACRGLSCRIDEGSLIGFCLPPMILGGAERQTMICADGRCASPFADGPTLPSPVGRSGANGEKRLPARRYAHRRTQRHRRKRRESQEARSLRARRCSNQSTSSKSKVIKMHTRTTLAIRRQ